MTKGNDVLQTSWQDTSDWVNATVFSAQFAQTPTSC